MALTEEQLRKWIADLKVSIANGGSDGYKTALAKAEAELAALLKTQDEARQAAAQTSQRQSLVDNLRGLSKTGGSAYQTVMGQVNKGNARIGALAASGRGGLNAGVNASNAQALSSSSGRMQGEAAREATKAGARNALGQVIAQGQDANNAAIQQQIADLQAAYGQAPSQNPYLTAAATVGGLAQAGYQAYGNQEDDKKKK